MSEHTEKGRTVRRPRVICTCLICGAEFSVKASHVSKGEGKTCSKDCWRKWMSQHFMGRGRNRIVKSCQMCGRAIEVKPSHADVEGTYCSQDCMAIAYRSRQQGVDNPNWKGGSMIKICKQCGTAHEVIRNRINNDQGEFCSVSCSATWRMLHQDISGRSIGGKREDLGGQYFRSSWEANYARYLNWLLSLGEIKRWEFEVDTFVFPGVRRGNMSYIPDFKITNRDDTIEYHEVKGYMDGDSAVKLRRMKKFYPNTKLVLVDKDAYKAIERQVSNFIPGWEKKSRSKRCA